jgi:hypothetical protein
MCTSRAVCISSWIYYLCQHSLAHYHNKSEHLASLSAKSHLSKPYRLVRTGHARAPLKAKRHCTNHPVLTRDSHNPAPVKIPRRLTFTTPSDRAYSESRGIEKLASSGSFNGPGRLYRA